MSRHRNYVFTYFTEGTWSPQDIWDQDKAPSGKKAVVADALQFLAGQFEISSTEARHFQGYAVFRNPQGLPGCRRILQTPHAHFETRIGSHTQALAYVSKEDTRMPGGEPLILGDPPGEGQGSRADLLAVKQIIDDGGTVFDVADKHFGTFLRYERGLQSYANHCATPRTDPPKTYYFWGPTGCGKSSAAWFAFEGNVKKVFTVPLSSGQTVWFDGYIPGFHEVIILDDYFHTFTFTFLLQLLDRYPFQVPVKGAFRPFNTPVIILTSNIGLHEQYPNMPAVAALWRRFNHVIRCFDDYWIECTITNPLGLLLCNGLQITPPFLAI